MLFQRALEGKPRILAEAVTRAQRAAFARQINRLIRQTGKLEARKVDAMVGLLMGAKSQVQDAIGRLPAGSFSRSMNRIIKSELERALADLSGRASTELGISQAEMAKAGLVFTNEIAEMQGGKPPPYLGLSPEIVENAATRSADLIRSLSERQLGRANEIINTAVITGRSVFDVSQEMARAFNKSVGQMETIARTEMLGIHSQVAMAQLSAMEETTPGLHKQWVSVQDERTRLGHRLSFDEGGAHLQSVPVKEPFRVPLTVVKKGVESLGDIEDMMYPRDPSASPGNSISCRCQILADYSQVEEPRGEPLTSEELPPVSVELTGAGKLVARELPKAFKNLR